MEFMDAFNKWLKREGKWGPLYAPKLRYSHEYRDHQAKCKFVKATSEPVMTTIRGGYCETCSYETSGLEFKGECTCGKESLYELEGNFELGKMMREMIELGS